MKTGRMMTMTIELTEQDCLSIIENAVLSPHRCTGCPVRTECTRSHVECAQRVHEAARRLYLGKFYVSKNRLVWICDPEFVKLVGKALSPREVSEQTVIDVLLAAQHIMESCGLFFSLEETPTPPMRRGDIVMTESPDMKTRMLAALISEDENPDYLELVDLIDLTRELSPDITSSRKWQIHFLNDPPDHIYMRWIHPSNIRGKLY